MDLLAFYMYKTDNKQGFIPQKPNNRRRYGCKFLIDKENGSWTI